MSFHYKIKKKDKKLWSLTSVVGRGNIFVPALTDTFGNIMPALP